MAAHAVAAVKDLPVFPRSSGSGSALVLLLGAGASGSGSEVAGLGPGLGVAAVTAQHAAASVVAHAAPAQEALAIKLPE